jgi:hypothetical protein
MRRNNNLELSDCTYLFELTAFEGITRDLPFSCSDYHMEPLPCSLFLPIFGPNGVIAYLSLLTSPETNSDVILLSRLDTNLTTAANPAMPGKKSG